MTTYDKYLDEVPNMQPKLSLNDPAHLTLDDIADVIENARSVQTQIGGPILQQRDIHFYTRA